MYFTGRFLNIDEYLSIHPAWKAIITFTAHVRPALAVSVNPFTSYRPYRPYLPYQALDGYDLPLEFQQPLLR